MNNREARDPVDPPAWHPDDIFYLPLIHVQGIGSYFPEMDIAPQCQSWDDFVNEALSGEHGGIERALRIAPAAGTCEDVSAELADEWWDRIKDTLELDDILVPLFIQIHHPHYERVVNDYIADRLEEEEDWEREKRALSDARL